MRIGSLFSGAGGLDMAVENVFGGETVWHSEIDKAASKVLAYRWPGVPNLGSITEIDWATVEPVDVLCGGFPCTDVSAAGKRAGMHGTRSGLWSYMAEAVDVLRPRYVVIENVRGLLNAPANRPLESAEDVVGDGSDGHVLRAAGAVLGDIQDIGGYEARWVTVAAADVGAPHRRERVFILATAADAGYRGQSEWAWQAGRETGERFSVGHVAGCGGEDAAVSGDEPGVALLPTPRSSDCFGVGRHGDGGMDLRTTIGLLPTPKAHDGEFGTPRTSGRPIEKSTHLGTIASLEYTSHWGKYAPAIARWEQIVGPAPAPTEPNRSGNPRLSAAFSEWLMGWPAGWVTDPAIGISRNDQLRIVGNGVVSRCAEAAIRYLLAVSA